jgi:stalled ribosome rescue protein Dom34
MTAVWMIFSNVIKPLTTVQLNGTWSDRKAVFNHCESIVDSLRPALREGVGSIVLVSPSRMNYAKQLIDHVHQHHVWLVEGPDKVTLTEVTGSAGSLPEVASLARTIMFRGLLRQAASEAADNLAELLDRYINSSDRSRGIAYPIEVVEKLITDPRRPGEQSPEYLMLTNVYLSTSSEKSRVQRLMQIAANRRVKTSVVDAVQPAGIRLMQLGGIVCLTRPWKSDGRRAGRHPAGADQAGKA